MCCRNRLGFTLAELLVVIVIIAILVGLLVPAIMGARESARQKQCMNRQAELAKAVAQYETAKDHYPGYVNPKELSWVIVLFEPLGQGQLWKEWRDGVPEMAGGKSAIITLPVLVCPDDQMEGEAPLSYVANCGRPGPGDFGTAKTDGIFHDRSGNVVPMPQISSADIVDGPAQTLLLSENIDAGQWTDFAEELVGFVWGGGGKSITDHLKSNHPGGVVATFCDTHQKFLRNSIDYKVYALLMTPNGAAAGQIGVPNGY